MSICEKECPIFQLKLYTFSIFKTNFYPQYPKNTKHQSTNLNTRPETPSAHLKRGPTSTKTLDTIGLNPTKAVYLSVCFLSPKI